MEAKTNVNNILQSETTKKGKKKKDYWIEMTHRRKNHIQLSVSNSLTSIEQRLHQTIMALLDIRFFDNLPKGMSSILDISH